MKHAISLLFMCVVAIAVSAQAANIEVSYEAHHPTLRNGKDDLTSQYILHANSDESKFYSLKMEYIDSLNSTPDGKAKLNEMTRNAYLGGKLDDIPRSDGSYYVVKSGNKYTYYDNSGLEKYVYEEPVAKLGWEIGDSTKTILGYECVMASVNYHGRIWTAWFAPEIPVGDGPWKLYGLPGLILEAMCVGGQYHFVATGLQQSDNAFYGVYSENNWEPISGNDFWKLRRECLENPSRTFNSGEATIIYKGANYENHLPKEIVDYIETDY